MAKAKKKASPKKKNYFFEFLNQITFTKDKSFYNEETKKDFSKFMMLRYLANDISLLPFANHCQRYINVLDDEQMYHLLVDIIPKEKKYIKYSKKVGLEKLETLDYIAKVFSCSQREARGYINIMGDDWANEIKKSFGGLGK